MARPSISTGTGDDGSTGLLQGGRTSKSALRIHALGSIDELNAIIGVVLADAVLPEILRSPLLAVQRSLFSAGADIASTGGGTGRLTPVAIEELERWGREMEGTLPELRRFILPGGAKVAALLHQARAVCRRAERWVVVLIREGQTCGFPLTGTPFPKRLRSRQAKLAFARSLTGCPESSISAEDLRNGGVNMNVLVYLNRLSDCLFLAARGVNQAAGKRETEV